MFLPASLRLALRRVLYAGSSRFCGVCERSARTFLPFGYPARPDARCPFCGSLERDRLTLRFVRARTDVFSRPGLSLLHIAPERGLLPLFQGALDGGYVTADLHNPAADLEVDITDLPMDDGSFDAVYCSHVLEHVDDDRTAMREFFRVLRPGGWAILNVPVTTDVTFEDPSVTDPGERLRLFGQHDHVRRYGPDYADRLAEAGFEVEIVPPRALFDEGEIRRHGLTNDLTGEVYFCPKPAI